MRKKLQDLKAKHPRYFDLKTAEEVYGIKHEVDCAENGQKFERC